MNEMDLNEMTFPCLNRDLSWVDFNERVLNEGLRKDLPLLERFRFLSIVSTNFDEFFMVRVATIKRMLTAETASIPIDPSGLSPAQQLKAISDKVHLIMKKQYDCLRDEIFPNLAKNGLSLLHPDSWSVPQLDFLDSYFVGQIYPVLTPLRLEDDKPIPFIESRALHAAFLLVQENADNASENPEQKVIVPLPSVLDRIIWLPSTDTLTVSGIVKEKLQLALLEHK